MTGNTIALVVVLLVLLCLSAGGNIWQFRSERQAAIDHALALDQVTDANGAADVAITDLEAALKTCERGRTADAEAAREAVASTQAALADLQNTYAAAQATLAARVEDQCARSANQPFCEVLP